MTDINDRHVSDLEFDATRVQLVEADPDVQDLVPLSGRSLESMLEERLKAHALLDNEVFVNATHVLKSPVTHRVLSRNVEFLEEGVVVPTMTDGHDGVDDMIDKKLHSPEQYGPWWTSNDDYEITESALEDRGELLSAHTSEIVYHDIRGMRDVFSGSILEDLKDPESGLARKVASSADLQRIRDHLEETDSSSRKFVYQIAGRVPESVRIQLKQQADINYHLTGAARRHATATFNPYDLQQMSHRLGKYVVVDEDGDDRRFGVVSDFDDGADAEADETVLDPRFSRPYDAMALLEYFRVTERIEANLGDLDSETIVDLRRRKETEQLAHTLAQVVERLPERDATDLTDVYGLRNAERKFRRMIRSELDREWERQHRRHELVESLTSPDDLASKGVLAGLLLNLVTTTGVSSLANNLLGADVQNSLATGGAASLIQSWLLLDGVPALFETDMIDFDKLYEEQT